MCILHSGNITATAHSYAVHGLGQPFLIKGTTADSGKTYQWYVVNERIGKPHPNVRDDYPTAQEALEALIKWERREVCNGLYKHIAQFHVIPTTSKKPRHAPLGHAKYLSSLKKYADIVADNIERDFRKGYTIAIPVKSPPFYKSLFCKAIEDIYGPNSVQFMLSSASAQDREKLMLKAKEREVKVTFVSTDYFSLLTNNVWDCLYSIEPITVDSYFLQTFKPPRDGDLEEVDPFLVRVFVDLNEGYRSTAAAVALHGLRSLGYMFSDSIPQVALRQKIEKGQ